MCKTCDPLSGPRKRGAGVGAGLGVEKIGDAIAEHFHVGGTQAACRRGRNAEAQSGPLRGAEPVNEFETPTVSIY